TIHHIPVSELRAKGPMSSADREGLRPVPHKLVTSGIIIGGPDAIALAQPGELGDGAKHRAPLNFDCSAHDPRFGLERSEGFLYSTPDVRRQVVRTEYAPLHLVQDQLDPDVHFVLLRRSPPFASRVDRASLATFSFS